MRWTILFLIYVGSTWADTVEVIQITASRTPQPLHQTGVAVSALFPDQVVEHPAQLLNRIPGVWLTQTSGQEQLTAIRSPVLTGAGSCSEFYFSQDQIPLRASGFCNVNQLFDAHTEMAQVIEVKRGPSSVIDGSNAIFGAIDVQLPYSLSQPFVRATMKSDHYQQLDLAMAHDQLLTLVSLQHDSGYRHSSGFEQQKISFRHQTNWADWQISSGLSISHLDQKTASFIEGEGAYLDKARRKENPTPNAYRQASAIRGHSRWHRSSQNSSLSITPYFRSNQMAFLMHFVPWQPEEENSHTSVGNQLRYSHHLSEHLELLAGIDMEFSQGQLQEFQHHPAPFSANKFPQGWHYDYKVQQTSTAADLGLDWQLTPRLNLKTAIRQDQIRYDYTNLLSSGSACAPEVSDCRFYRPESGDYRFHGHSAQASLNYLYSAKQFAYLTLNRGFRAPHTSELFRLQQGQEKSELKPVQATSIELGHKLRFTEFQLDLALFWMALDEGVFQNSERHYVSGAQSLHQGIEYELSWNVLADWQVRWNGSYARHRYQNSPDLLSSSAKIKGNEIDTAPRTLNSLSLSWQATHSLSFELSQQRMGAYYLDPENSASYPGHQLWHLAAHWQNNGWDWALQLTNLSDEAYAKRADLSFETPRYLPGEGRQAQLSFTYHW